MKLTQSWVGYLDRSYQQIKNSLIARLVINNPEITDHNESNILIIIMSMFSGVAEMLNYYIDMMAREGYLGTAQRFTSVIRLAALIDYNVRAKTMATVNQLFVLSNADGTPYYTTAFITIPKGTIVTDVNGTIFKTLGDVQIVPGQAGAFSVAAQWTDVVNNNIGITDGTLLQKIKLDADYVDESLVVTLNNVPWKLYRSAGLMTRNTQGFIVQVQEDGNAYMIFGDSINGKVPDTGINIIATYKICKGASGDLPPGAINQLNGVFTIPAGVTISTTNPDYSSGGSDFQTIEDVRNKAPRAIRTLERAVTYQDYIDVAIQVPEVGDAAVSYCCGKFVSVYVVPITQGVATLALLSKVTDWFSTRKMITTKVTILASGVSKIFVTATLFAKPLYTANQVSIEVNNILYSKFGFEFAEINSKPSVSDMISLMESAASVDHVDVASVQILPYVSPVEGNTTPLDIAFTILPKTNTKFTYTFIYRLSSNTFQIFRGSNPLGSIGTGQVFNDGILSFKINSANYADGTKWQFVTVPSYPEIFPVTQLSITDFTIPIMDIGPLVDANVPRTIYGNFTVVTQGVNSNCLPTCP